MARQLSTHSLQYVFGIFACLLGIFFIKPLKTTLETHEIPSFFLFTLIGIGVACLSNLLGLGGGFFMLPIFLYFHFQGKKAIGTSSATSFLISLGGSIG